MEKKVFQVPNIGCDGCVRTIQNELSALPGVQNVKAEVVNKTVTLEYGAPASWDQIEAKLKEIDYAPAAPLMP